MTAVESSSWSFHTIFLFKIWILSNAAFLLIPSKYRHLVELAKMHVVREDIALGRKEKGDAFCIRMFIFSVCRLLRPVGSSVVSSLWSSFDFTHAAHSVGGESKHASWSWEVLPLELLYYHFCFVFVLFLRIFFFFSLKGIHFKILFVKFMSIQLLVVRYLWRPDLFLKLKQLSVGLLCSFVMLRSLWRKKIFSILGIVCSRIAPIASSHEIFSDWRSLEILLVPCVWYAECHMLLISEVGIRNDSYNQPAWAQCIYI